MPITACAPLPVSDFRHVFAMLADVVLMLDELVLKLLLQIPVCAGRSPTWHWTNSSCRRLPGETS